VIILRGDWPKFRAVISVGVEICLFTTVSRPTKFPINQIPDALSQGVEPPVPSNKRYAWRIGDIAPLFLKLRDKMFGIMKQMHLIRMFKPSLFKLYVHYSIHNSRTTPLIPNRWMNTCLSVFFEVVFMLSYHLLDGTFVQIRNL